MRIRRYVDADFDGVVALWDAAGISVPYNDPALEIPIALASPNTALFVGEREGAPIATILAGHEGHRGWLYKLAVAPAHRRQGLGRQLVAHAETWLAARGMPKINLMIRDTNLAVRDFYAALGYAVSPRMVMAKGLDAAHAEPDDGRIEVVVTLLEMATRPIRVPPPHPAGQHALLRAQAPPTAFYRFLYETVGESSFWHERRLMSDEALRAIIDHPAVEIYVLHADGCPAGFVELDRRREPIIDIALFGIMPEFIGRGLGAFLLGWAVERSWSHGPDRLTVNTCSLDHPNALRLYQRAGFVPVGQVRKSILDPRRLGVIPAGLEPRRP